MSKCFPICSRKRTFVCVVDSPFGVDNTALEFNYYQKIPALSAGANWLFGTHPDLYLFGSLVEACLFAPEKAASAPAWKTRRDEIFDEIETLSNKTRGAGAIHVMGVTP